MSVDIVRNRASEVLVINNNNAIFFGRSFVAYSPVMRRLSCAYCLSFYFILGCISSGGNDFLSKRWEGWKPASAQLQITLWPDSPDTQSLALQSA